MSDSDNENSNKSISLTSATIPLYMVFSLIAPIASTFGAFYTVKSDINLINKDVGTIQTSITQSNVDNEKFRTLLQGDILKAIDIRISELKTEIAVSNNQAFSKFNENLYTLKQDIQRLQTALDQVNNSYLNIQSDQKSLRERVKTLEDQITKMNLELARLEAKHKVH